MSYLTASWAALKRAFGRSVDWTIRYPRTFTVAFWLMAGALVVAAVI